jgi:hypothetical protein
MTASTLNGEFEPMSVRRSLMPRLDLLLAISAGL